MSEHDNKGCSGCLVFVLPMGGLALALGPLLAARQHGRMSGAAASAVLLNGAVTASLLILAALVSNYTREPPVLQDQYDESTVVEVP